MASLNDVRVAGWIGPFADTDVYYCIDPLWGIDGLRSVPDKATRNAITHERRRQGMFVVVQQDFGSGPNTIWQLKAPTWNDNDADWIQVLSGASSGTPSGTAGQVLIIDDTTTSFSSIIEVYSATSPNATGVGSVVFGNNVSTASGPNSLAGGFIVTVSGENAFGFGSNVMVSGQNAFGFGSNVTASGDNSTATGENTVAAAQASQAGGSGSGAYGFASDAVNQSLSIGDGSHSEGGSATYGYQAHGEGTNSNGAGDSSHVEGENCWAGPTPWACTLANVGGVTVATITGTEAATWFAHNDFVTLILLIGGSGMNFTTAQVNTSVPSGGNSIITLTTLATNATSGQIFATGKVKNGHAGGFNSFADLPNKFARSDGGFYNGAGSPYSGSGQATSTTLSVTTTNATETELRISGGTIGASGAKAYRFTIPEGFTYGFECSVIARKTDGSAGALMRRQGLVHRDSGVVSLIGSIGTIGADINSPGWVLAITADNTNKSIKVTGTGTAATTIIWFAELRCWEIGLPTSSSRVAPLT